MSRMIVVALLSVLFSSAASAASEEEITRTLKSKIRMIQHMALNPLLIKAVRRQNSEALDMTAITQRDEDWEIADEASALKSSMLTGDHALIMQRFIDDNHGLSEIYLTDNQGANVAAYPLTDDYWQGDEEEWTGSYNDGSGQVFIGALEQDKRTNSIYTRVAAPVLDRNRTIGVLVVGLKLGGIQN